MAAPSIYRSPEGERAVLAAYDAILRRWPVPYETSRFSTGQGETAAILCGERDAPPLVLLHGAGTSSAMWAGDVDAYARRHRVVALDLPGEPGGSAPNRPSWEGPAFAEWLADALDALAIDRAVIVGLSQGAWTALKLAVASPERVRALSLLSPGGITGDRLSFVVRVLPLMLLGEWGAGRIRRLVLGGQAVPEDVARSMSLVQKHFKPRLGVLPIFTDDELRRLTMPVQLLMGGRDAMRDAAAIAARMRSVVPHLQATTIPEAGHALLGATPHVLRFLDAVLVSPQTET